MADIEPARLPVPLLDGERAQEHDDLTREASEILRTWIAKRAIICNHTQVLEYPEAADELMKMFGARIDQLRDQYDQAFAALQRRTEEWEGEQAARVAAEQATIAADQRAQKAEAERDEARKGKVEQMLGRLDDWGGDLATVVQERDAARAERDEVLAEMREEARTADELRRNRDQLADELTAARAEMEKRGKALADWQRVAGQHQAAMLDAKNRADHLTQQIQGLWTVKTWTNEDRRKFVFVEDLLNALHPDLAPKPEAERGTLAGEPRG